MRHLAVLLLCASLLPAASLRRLRSAALAGFEIRGLSFSPGARWIAVLAARGTGFLRDHQLLVIPRDPGPLRFSSPAGALPSDSRAFPLLSWSPAADALAVATQPPLLVPLSAARPCQFAPTQPGDAVLLGGFLSPDTIVTAEPGPTSRLVVSGRDCRPQLHLELPGRIVSLDADAVSGHIALAFQDGATAVWDGRAGRQLARWPPAGPPGTVKLLGPGSIVCQAVTPDPDRHRPRCRPLSAAAPPQQPDAWGGLPFAVSTQASLALFADGKYSYDAFWDEAHLRVRALLLWDAAAGLRLLRLPSRNQRCDSLLPSDPECPRPWVFALSPDGRFLAQAGNGRLELFSLAR